MGPEVVLTDLRQVLWGPSSVAKVVTGSTRFLFLTIGITSFYLVSRGRLRWTDRASCFQPAKDYSLGPTT
jgi:hypothetical protein